MKIAPMVFVFGLLAASQSPTSAFAATTTASFSVSAVVLASCQVSVPVAAWRSGTAAEVNTVSTLSVACDHPTPYSVTLSTGPSDAAGQKLTDPDPIMRMGELPIDFPQAMNWLRSVHLAASAELAISNRPKQPATSIPKALARIEAPDGSINSITITVTY